VDKIARFVTKREGELVRLVGDLVAARTENPPGNEHLAVPVVKSYLQRYGIGFRVLEAAPGRANIIATVGTGRPRVLIACHLDVVPAGEHWRTDPFRAVVRRGRIFGRGACDNKGPLAAMLLAGACLKTLGLLPRSQVILAAVADEERGSALGMEWLLRHHKLTADFGIVPDIAAHLREIDVAEKGAVFFEVISHGRQAHGSRPEQGINAIWNMLHFLERLRAAKLPAVRHRFLTPPTLNLGTIQGGSAPNMVPGLCRVGLDIRYLPGTTSREVKAVIRAAMHASRHETGGRFQFRQIADLPPTEVPTDAPLVRALAAATKAVIGRAPRPAGMSGATLTKQLIMHGIPAVGCGPGDMREAHAANESVPIAELLAFARILTLTCVTLAKPKE